MRFQGSDCREKPIAYVAENIIDGKMRFQVAIQNRFDGKTFATIITFERFFSGMDANMSHQIAHLFEGSAAVAAYVFFLHLSHFVFLLFLYLEQRKTARKYEYK